MNLFLDTNALIKLYHEEVGTEKLVDFLEANVDDLIITISDLSKIEFYSAFFRRVRTQELDLSIAHQIFNGFEEDVKAFYVVEIENTVKKVAIQLLNFYAHEKSLRTLDALQLSAAVISHQNIPIDYFVSSDAKLLNIANDFFTILNVED